MDESKRKDCTVNRKVVALTSIHDGVRLSSVQPNFELDLQSICIDCCYIFVQAAQLLVVNMATDLDMTISAELDD